MVQSRQIIHVDMDAFYASVEQLDNPKLKGKSVIVGGALNQRGVVSAASYEARKFGVHSAMPMAQAIKLCPQAIVLPVRMQRYVQLSEQIHTIFQEYTPQIEPLSIDEAFLDVTGSLSLFGSAETIGHEIKLKIKEQLNLVASVGIAPNKFLAKLASDLDKPNGFVVITDENCQEVLDPLPVGRIWGIGKVTQKALRAEGIETVKQLKETPLGVLRRIFGNQTEQMLSLARGQDDRPVESEQEAKSISSEQTFARDVMDREFLFGILLQQVEEVAYRLRAHGLKARTLTLKIRYGDFKTITRSSTLNESTQITKVLWQEAEAILGKWFKQSAQPLRLLGFGVSGLADEHAGQQSLFPDPEGEKQQRLDQTFDAIRKRYGKDALKHGG